MKYSAPDGRGDTTPDELYDYKEVMADSPQDNVTDQGTLPDLIERHPWILGWLKGDESLLYTPIVLRVTIGLVTVTLRPHGWN